MKLIQGAGRYTDPGTEATNWVEHLRVADLSVGTYSIPAGGTDGQAPHTEDEIYVIQWGRAALQRDDGNSEVVPGSVVYVPAHEGHRFVSITEDFAALVLFAPAEYSRAGKKRMNGAGSELG